MIFKTVTDARTPSNEKKGASLMKNLLTYFLPFLFLLFIVFVVRKRDRSIHTETTKQSVSSSDENPSHLAIISDRFVVSSNFIVGRSEH